MDRWGLGLRVGLVFRRTMDRKDGGESVRTDGSGCWMRTRHERRSDAAIAPTGPTRWAYSPSAVHRPPRVRPRRPADHAGICCMACGRLGVSRGWIRLCIVSTLVGRGRHDVARRCRCTVAAIAVDDSTKLLQHGSVVNEAPADAETATMTTRTTALWDKEFTGAPTRTETETYEWKTVLAVGAELWGMRHIASD